MDVNLDGNTITNAYLSDIVVTGAADLSDALLTLPPDCVDVSNINATGTPSSTTYLRGDGTWSSPPGPSATTLTGDASGSGTGTIVTTVGGINGANLATLSTGLLKNTTSTGIPTIAVAGTDYLAPSSIGVTVQGYNANTTTLGNTTTGSGSIVLATSPALTTPSLGAATATSINGLAISSSTGTLTVANGKTLIASNSLTLSGTDGSALDVGTGGTLGALATVIPGTGVAAAAPNPVNDPNGLVVANSIGWISQSTSGAAFSVAGNVGVINGGTGQAYLSSGNILTGNGSSPISSIAPGTGVATMLAAAINSSSGAVTQSGGDSRYPIVGATSLSPSGASPSVTINLALGTYFVVTLSGASGTPTISFSNVQPGATCTIEMVQGSTALNCTFPSNTIQAGGGGATYTASGASATDLIAVAFKDATDARIAVTRSYA